MSEKVDVEARLLEIARGLRFDNTDESQIEAAFIVDVVIPKLDELEAARERADKLSKLIVEQEADYREREKALRGWLYWFDNGGGASKTIAGFREALAAPTEEWDGG